MKDRENLLISRAFIADCKRNHQVDPVKLLDAFAQLYFDGKEPDNLTDAEQGLFDQKKADVLNNGVLE